MPEAFPAIRGSALADPLCCRMIPKSGNRFSGKIMRKRNVENGAWATN